MTRQEICECIAEEMTMATGCTEPAAVALAAATAKTHLEGEVEAIEVCASANMIKNVTSAGIPGMQQTGIAYAAALGATGGDPAKCLQVVDGACEKARAAAQRLVDGGKVTLTLEEACDRLYVSVRLCAAQGHWSRAVIEKSHTNIELIETDKGVICRKSDGDCGGATRESKTLSLHEVWQFVQEADPAVDDLAMIQRAWDVNMGIMEEGLRQDYGLAIGRHLRSAMEKGLCGKDIVNDAVSCAAGGVDARMAGANVPVVTNSGSGNQGITATVPVIRAGKTLGAPEDKIFRAVLLSNLMAIYIHAGFGRLSGLCGATIAATGAGCGVVYLLGGGEAQIGSVVNNMLGDVSGMLCDGAKADCALKVSTCLQAAFQCAFLAMDNVTVRPTDGIVEQDPEATVSNFNRLGNEGSPAMDKVVLDILVRKNAANACTEE